MSYASDMQPDCNGKSSRHGRPPELRLFEVKQGVAGLALSRPENENSRQARLQQDTYVRTLRLLHERPDITQREMAAKLGLSLGGLNYCLRALIEKGWVKMKSFQNSPGKGSHAYVLTPRGLSEKTALTVRFLQRKMKEYEELGREIESLSGENRHLETQAPSGEVLRKNSSNARGLR